MSEHFEAAIRAGAAAIKAPIIFHERDHYEAYAEAALTAALPDLEKHFAQNPNVRQAIIQELANEAEASKAALERRIAGDLVPSVRDRFERDWVNLDMIGDWLLAKLKEADRG